MQWKAKAFGGVALVVVGSFGVAACGSGDGSKQNRVTSVVAGASGTSGAAGATGAGTKAPRGTSGTSGGASVPSRKPPKSRTGAQPKSSHGAAGGPPKQRRPSGAEKNASNKGGNGGGNVESGPPSYFTGQQKELYREAKVVCDALTLDGLAKEYVVKKTPEAVARAYSASYPPNLRGAVFMGCKAAFSKR